MRKRWEQRKMEDFRRNGAALTIQRAWRRVLRGRRQKARMRVVRQRKAVIIQKYYRRHRARKLVVRLKKDRDDMAVRAREAAILVRSCCLVGWVGLGLAH